MWERERNSCDHFEPVLHPSPSSRQHTQHCCRCQISSAEWRNGRVEKRRLRTSTGNGRSACTGKLRRDWLFTKALRTIDSGGVSKRTKKIFLGFFKKSWKSILKKRKVKKKSGIPPKSGRLTSLEDIPIILAAWTHAYVLDPKYNNTIVGVWCTQYVQRTLSYTHTKHLYNNHTHTHHPTHTHKHTGARTGTDMFTPPPYIPSSPPPPFPPLHHTYTHTHTRAHTHTRVHTRAHSKV